MSVCFNDIPVKICLNPLPLNVMCLWFTLFKRADQFNTCFVQLRPEVSSVSEDGRLYELVVESTVPVPCLKESSSSAEPCTLSLQLSTSSKGESSEQDNNHRLYFSIFCYTIMKITTIFPPVLWQMTVCWVQICLSRPVWCICPGAPVQTGFAAEHWSTSAPSLTFIKTATGRLRSLLNLSSHRILCGMDTHLNQSR